MKKRILSILLVLCLCLSIIPMSSLSTAAKTVDDDLVETGFSPDNFKAQIKKVSIGAPITGTDGKKYLPVDVHFFAAENLSDSDMVYFLEGYLKAQLKGGGLAESIRGLGMTLMGPLKTDVPLESNMWNWDWTPYETGGGQGVIKYNVPLLEESETQSVEQSQATGMTEVNGVKVGDEITLQNETVVNTNNIPEQIVQELFPDGPSVFSDPVTFTVEEASKYPKEITISTDDKTVAPPQEVVLPYTGQPQECPYKATAGYTVSLNDPQTDAGIYTAALILNSGWKWTDGTTEAKPAVWAINKATITSVTLSANQLTYNGKDQTPMITSVKAGDLTVPANGYTATFPEPSKFANNYTVTVKGKGNFTGSASADYSIVAIYADTCNHIEYPREYVDNKDNATHKAFCTHCGGCLANAEKHDLKNEPVNDPETGKPAGKYRTVCAKCGYAVDGDCDHSVPREYVDNGNGTHDERCSRCHVVFKTNEAHDLKATAVLSNVSGYEIYNGEVSVDCTKCSYHQDQLCSHAGTGRDDYVPAKGSYPNFTHRSHCARCKKLMFEEEEACTPGEWEPKGLAAHHTHCTKCGQEITGYHDFKGTRKITKFEATPYKGGAFNLFTRYNYRCYYTETCKDCHGVRQGWFDYPIIDVERWADYRAAFESIVKMNPEQLQSFSDQDYLEGYKYFLMIPSWFLSTLYEATGTNEMNFANLQSGWLTKLTNTNEAGSCKMFDKNGKEIASYKPKDKNSTAPTGGDGIAATGDDEGISEDDLETWRFTEEDGAAVALSTDYLMSLPDGEYTYTACFSNENGDTAAVSVVFNIESDEIGKKVTNVHPLGTMVNADGDVVGMNLSSNYALYTGEAIDLPAVTLTSSMGVEYAEDEDYTLTYYQVVDGADGEAIEVEIAKEDIKDVGTYNVVAAPTRNGVLSGEAWAQFRVIDPADCPHNWEILSDAGGHWEHCTICGVSKRSLPHEKGSVTAKINRVPVPIDGDEDTNLLFVSVYSECPECGYLSCERAYNVTHSCPLESYNLAALRNAEINKSGNAIHMNGDFIKQEQIFWDGTLLNGPSDIIGGDPAQYNKEEGSIILLFTDEFLSNVEDGDHELLVCNGDEFTVMTVTAADHKLIELKKKDLNEYDEMDYSDYDDLLTEFGDNNCPIIYCNLDNLLLLGDVDCDGEVDIIDVTIIQRHLAGIPIPFIFIDAVADVDGDGDVSAIDATLIQRWLASINAPKGIGQPLSFVTANGERSALIGSWAYEEDENFVYPFNANGTGTYDVYGEILNFTYTDNGNSVEIVFDDAPGTFDYTVDGNTLVLVDSTGAEVRYIKK